MSYNWLSRNRNYEDEAKQYNSTREEATTHPLRSFAIQEGFLKKRIGGGGSSLQSTPQKTAAISLDPLSSVLDGLDPLSQFAAEEPFISQENMASKQMGPENFEPWESKKAAILSKYTTCEKLSITLSNLTLEKGIKGVPTTVSDKVKNRLEQLDDFEEGSVKEMQNLTQQEYMNHIEELNMDLKMSWEQDQRVKALKIAIQCAKLLVNTNVIHFYPSKFVLITDILDTFGKLVYNRILSMAKGSNKMLSDNFTPDQVPETAKGTCRNWFYKIASIRELVPRFYVECALLRSHCFIYSRDYSQALLRLTKMIRGIGDPLVAVYARCYLCRVGMSIAPNCHHYLKENFSDFLSSYHQLQSGKVRELLSSQNLSLPTYLTLYIPALDWILQCVAYQGTEADFSTMLAKCHHSSALLLNSVMCAFKPEYIATRALELVGIIKECDETVFPKPLLFRTLGLCLMLSNPPESHRLQILNEVWKVVTKFKDPNDYVSCAEVWIEFPVKHFSANEVNTFLDDIIKHLTPDRAFEQHYGELIRILDQILSHSRQFSTLVTTDRFLPFLDLFQKESYRSEACKIVLEAFVKSHAEPTNDPVLINTIMYICKTLHDSVNALTVEDEKRQIAVLIAHFVRKVKFGRDFEQQLSFYVEARATFSNLDPVLVQLVQCVNHLAIQTRQVVKGHHTRKTSSFVKACSAYSFITIPSLVDVFSRLELYLVSGQVALLNLCLSQADAFFKAAISLLPEVPPHLEGEGGKTRPTEAPLVAYISNFLSTLLVVPDHPDQEPLYLVRGLLNVVLNYTWDPSHSDARCSIYLKALALLSALAQESYLYHVDGVESNDELYGSDPKFLAEVNALATTLLEEILAHLKYLADNGLYRRQSNLALELVKVLLAHADLSQEPSLANLASNLWGLAHRHGTADPKSLVATSELAKRMASRFPQNKVYQQLASRLQPPTRL